MEMKEVCSIAETTVSQAEYKNILDLRKNIDVQWWFRLSDLERVIIIADRFNIDKLKDYIFEYVDGKLPVLIKKDDVEHNPVDLLDVSLGDYMLLHIISIIGDSYRDDFYAQESVIIEGKLFNYLDSIIDTLSDDAFVRMSEYMDIALGKLSHLPVNWARFKGITQLYFENNIEIPSEFSGFNDLKEISVEPENFWINDLDDVSLKGIDKFPTGFSNFKNLKRLNLSFNPISVIPDNIACEFNGLERLYLYNTNVTLEEVLNLKSLKTLRFLGLPKRLKEYEDKLKAEFHKGLTLNFL